MTWPSTDGVGVEDGQLLAQPVASAQVSVSGSQQRMLTTGRDGQFSFAALPPGDYMISVRLPATRNDLAPIEPQRPFRPDGAYACAEVNVWAESRAGRVIDRVDILATGEPIAITLRVP